jgi:hypothetical protein
MIYKNTQGKKIGELKDGVFKKQVSKKKHLFRSTSSWAIQEEVLKELPPETVIQIFDKDDKILYSTTAQNFREKCDYLSFKDYGLQGYLPLRYFSTGGTK